jgi:hypothetical protein
MGTVGELGGKTEGVQKKCSRKKDREDRRYTGEGKITQQV